MFIEVIVCVLLLFSVISLFISWISLNLQLEFRENAIELFSTLTKPSNDTTQVMKSIRDIEEFLSQLMQVMGNPFQMLAATHGARILDRIFPPKVEAPDLRNENNRGDSSLLPPTPSGEPWQDVEQPQNVEEAEEVPE